MCDDCFHCWKITDPLDAYRNRVRIVFRCTAKPGKPVVCRKLKIKGVTVSETTNVTECAEYFGVGQEGEGER